MKNSSKAICGAHARQTGKPCEKPPLKGKKRCKLHGGATPKGTKGNRTHGLYSQHMTEDEQGQWESIQLGAVDDELRMMRIFLNRCIALEALIMQSPGTVELSEVRRSVRTDGDAMDTISRRPDVYGRIDRITGRIAQLEKTRAELIAAAQANSENPGDRARIVVDAMKAIMDTEGDL